MITFKNKQTKIVYEAFIQLSDIIERALEDDRNTQITLTITNPSDDLFGDFSDRDIEIHVKLDKKYFIDSIWG